MPFQPRASDVTRQTWQLVHCPMVSGSSRSVSINFRVPEIDADWSVRSTGHNCGAIPQVIWIHRTPQGPQVWASEAAQSAWNGSCFWTALLIKGFVYCCGQHQNGRTQRCFNQNRALHCHDTFGCARPTTHRALTGGPKVRLKDWRLQIEKLPWLRSLNIFTANKELTFRFFLLEHPHPPWKVEFNVIKIVVPWEVSRAAPLSYRQKCFRKCVTMSQSLDGLSPVAHLNGNIGFVLHNFDPFRSAGTVTHTGDWWGNHGSWFNFQLVREQQWRLEMKRKQNSVALNGAKNACLLNFYYIFRMVVRLQFMLDSW